MTELHAYTPTTEFAEAWRANEAARAAFQQDVVKPWNKKHPNNYVAYGRSPFGLDEYVLGFIDGAPDQPPPEGLSRKQGRPYLIEVRGKKGDPWRQAMARLGKIPSRDKILQAASIPSRVEAPGPDFTIRMCPVVPQDFDGTLVVVCTQPIEPLPDSLTPMPLSQYYAMKEAAAARADSSEATP